MIGLFTTGSSGLGWLAVIGRSRVPSPPAITTAFTCYPSPPLIRHISHHFIAAGHGSWPASPALSRPASPRPARPPSRPRLAPARPGQAACLLQVQNGG